MFITIQQARAHTRTAYLLLSPDSRVMVRFCCPLDSIANTVSNVASIWHMLISE